MSSLKYRKAYSDLEQKYLSIVDLVSLFLTQAQNLLLYQSQWDENWQFSLLCRTFCYTLITAKTIVRKNCGTEQISSSEFSLPNMTLLRNLMEYSMGYNQKIRGAMNFQTTFNAEPR